MDEMYGHIVNFFVEIKTIKSLKEAEILYHSIFGNDSIYIEEEGYDLYDERDIMED